MFCHTTKVIYHITVEKEFDIDICKDFKVIPVVPEIYTVTFDMDVEWEKDEGFEILDYKYKIEQKVNPYHLLALLKKIDDYINTNMPELEKVRIMDIESEFALNY